VAVIVVVALLCALAVDGVVADLRASDAIALEARASLSAETALATVLDAPLDSAAQVAPAGTLLASWITGGADSASAFVTTTAPGIAVAVARAVKHRGTFRAIAGRMAYLAVVADSASPTGVRLSPIGPRWWAALP
jgi:hypothetical protein